MAVTLEQFLESLSITGLMAADEVKAVRQGLAGRQPPPTAETFARELVQSGKLTRFQARALYEGKAKGLVCGEYVLLDRIGAGGMGQVYKAHHKRMNRVVALKLLTPRASTVAEKQKAVKRFYQEVEVAARLLHPNIVVSYDAGESNGLHYLVMELVEGQDLSSLLKPDKKLPLDQALGIILQAARGLAYAHGEGIIHRDIKPSNLLLDKQGKVKILDLGLARAEQALAGGDPIEHGLTGTGEIMGTADYMPPEQSRSMREADARSDIYSLGCTLFRLVAGRVPYGGGTAVEKFLAHVDQPIPTLSADCEGVSPRLQRTFERMLAKQVENRFQSMNEVIAELEACRADVPDEDHSPLVIDEPPQDSSAGSFLSGGASSASSSRKGIPPIPPPPRGHSRQPASAATMPSTVERSETPPNSKSLVVTLLGGAVVVLALVVGILVFTRGSGGERPQKETAVASGDPKASPPNPINPEPPVAPVEPAKEPEKIGAETPAEPTAKPPALTPAPVEPTTTTTKSPVIENTSPPQAVSAIAPPVVPSTGVAPTGPMPPQPTSTSTESVAPTRVRSQWRPGVRVDLLQLVDLKRDSIDGVWNLQPGALSTPSQSKAERGNRNNARLQFQYVPPAEYELHVDVELLNRLSHCSVGMLVGQSQVVFNITQYPNRNAGLELVDGENSKNNGTAVTGAPFSVGDLVRIVCRVQAGSVKTWLNGRPIVDWKGDPQRLSLQRGDKPPDPTKLFVNCICDTRITNYEVVPLGATPLLVPANDAVAAARAKLPELVGELPRDATASRKSSQAASMHYQASLAIHDDATCYALLTEALRLAAQADDMNQAFAVLEDLERCFQVDALGIYGQTLIEVTSAAAQRPIPERRKFFGRVIESADQQMAAERYDIASLLVKSASTLVAKLKEPDLQKELHIRELEANEWQRMRAAAKAGEAGLTDNQQSPEAHRALGEYLACARGDWQAALIHLAKTPEVETAAAANLELQTAKDPTKSFEVGSSWLAAAEKASSLPLKVVYLEHARTWLTRGSEGVNKTALAKLIARFKKLELETRRGAGMAFLKRHPVASVPFAGHWYRFYDESLPWHEARRRCQEMGGDLAVPDNPAKCQFVYQLAAAQFGAPEVFDFWIGATEEGHDGQFAWITGAPLQFSDWDSKEPDARFFGEAVAAHRQATGAATFKWADQLPKTANVFVCEWER